MNPGHFVEVVFVSKNRRMKVAVAGVSKGAEDKVVFASNLRQGKQHVSDAAARHGRVFQHDGVVQRS